MVENRLEKLLTKAIRNKATDIHLHFTQNTQSLSFRTLQGIQKEESALIDEGLYQYLKYLANLDLASTMVPQSGSFMYVVDDFQYFFRFSALETIFIKSGVIRILNLSPLNSLEDLGEPLALIEQIRHKLNQRSGLVLFSGLTGSGKTTTMFMALSELENRSIYTVEDPIETHYDQLMQAQINRKTGLDYEAIIKQLLRHDPDLLVIGEVRSEVEAKALIRATLSGHLVCTTIHASNLKTTLARLLDFNISAHELSMMDITIFYQELRVKDAVRYAHFKIMENDEIQNFLKPHHR